MALAALERMEKSPWTYHRENVVTALAPSFFIQSSSFLQVTRIIVKAFMSLNFGQIPPLTLELSALEHLKNQRDHSSTFILDRIFFIFAGNKLELWPISFPRWRPQSLGLAQNMHSEEETGTCR